MKYTLVSYLILLVVVIFFLNKFVHMSKNIEKKVLGSYYSQMEEINKATGMEVYNLKKKSLSKEELDKLKQIY